MRRVISGICPSHGYHHGDICLKCEAGETVNTFHTHKDKLYEFTTYDFGKPIEIRSKGQFERLLKENNKYQIIRPRDFEIEKKRRDNNQKEKHKREVRKTAEEVYRWAKTRCR